MNIHLKKTLEQKLKDHPTMNTVAGVARATGMNRSTVHKLFAGQNKRPKESTVAPLLKFFNCSYDELLGEEYAFDKNIQEFLKNNICNLVALTNLRHSDLIKEIRIVDADLTRLMKGAQKFIGDKTLQPFCDYFGVTLDQLRGYEPIDLKKVKAFLQDKKARVMKQGMILFNKAKENNTPVPILSNVQAGCFTDIDNFPEDKFFYVPKEWVPHDQCFLLIIAGESMLHAYDNRSMHEGDMVLVDLKKQAHDGAVVIAVKDDQAATVKIFDTSNNSVHLRPLNKKFADITEHNYHGSECRIIGVVTKIIPKIRDVT